MFLNLIYVSHHHFSENEAQRETANILAVARRRNAELGITGTLLRSKQRFAQLLEGEPEVVLEHYRRIARDPRHQDVRVVDRQIRPRRQFEGWSMAYCGDTNYVHRYVDALTLVPPDPLAVASFRRLLHELVAVGGIGQKTESA